MAKQKHRIRAKRLRRIRRRVRKLYQAFRLQPGWLKISIIASAVIASLAVGMIVFLVTDLRQSDTMYTKVRDRAVYFSSGETVSGIDAQAEKDTSRWDGTGASLEIDFAALKGENDDTVGWLHVPAADISYPVLYATDNDYYANRAFDGTESAAGSIYLECTNATAFTDRNSLIYGHNMRDKSMFGALQERFLQEGNYLSMPFFYVYLPDGTVNRYFIFSYYETSVGSDTFSTFTEDDAYDYYVYYAKTLTEAKEEASAVLEQAGVADAVTEAGALFAERAPIVTLSTCAGPSGTTKRFVVHGVLYGTAGMTAND